MYAEEEIVEALEDTLNMGLDRKKLLRELGIDDETYLKLCKKYPLLQKAELLGKVNSFRRGNKKVMSSKISPATYQYKCKTIWKDIYTQEDEMVGDTTEEDLKAIRERALKDL